ncbi:glycosyltransferase family 1 protein [Mycolicibacterium sp. F2034L]|uniref:glycosyltransferase family 4 protein n=1 Tax=Mycolicibacterium sp. F2034L TaxID=2926422 RepID=UPI001FF43860|nr:glycosyltransferase family 1 protein [Mycolicibacterium sp. F2034L]MCK0173775.1 glycosyltransferase family 4 protein [Mycolicibacterium sp. F2034L]
MTELLYIDNRYRGNHGIARYAAAVVANIDINWTPLAGKYRPGSPLDVVDYHRMRLPRDSVLYNPGYTAGPTRAKQLLTIHDLTHLRVEGERGQLNRLYYNRIVKPAITKAGHVLTVSETTAGELRKWLGHGIEVHNAGNGCSDIFGINHGAERLDRPYFLFVGNFKPHKNPEPLFKAMRKFPEHQLVVVSADRKSASTLASRYGIEDRIQVRAGISDVELSRLYRGAEALIFPSIWEGFGLPVVEALKSETKVVYSSVAESVADICDGTQYPVEDAMCSDALTAAMETAIGSVFKAPANLPSYSWADVSEKVEAVINLLR